MEDSDDDTAAYFLPGGIADDSPPRRSYKVPLTATGMDNSTIGSSFGPIGSSSATSMASNAQHFRSLNNNFLLSGLGGVPVTSSMRERERSMNHRVGAIGAIGAIRSSSASHHSSQNSSSSFHNTVSNWDDPIVVQQRPNTRPIMERAPLRSPPGLSTQINASRMHMDEPGQMNPNERIYNGLGENVSNRPLPNYNLGELSSMSRTNDTSTRTLPKQSVYVNRAERYESPSYELFNTPEPNRAYRSAASNSQFKPSQEFNNNSSVFGRFNSNNLDNTVKVTKYDHSATYSSQNFQRDYRDDAPPHSNESIPLSSPSSSTNSKDSTDLAEEKAFITQKQHVSKSKSLKFHSPMKDQESTITFPSDGRQMTLLVPPSTSQVQAQAQQSSTHSPPSETLKQHSSHNTSNSRRAYGGDKQNIRNRRQVYREKYPKDSIPAVASQDSEVNSTFEKSSDKVKTASPKKEQATQLRIDTKSAASSVAEGNIAKANTTTPSNRKGNANEKLNNKGIKQNDNYAKKVDMPVETEIQNSKPNAEDEDTSFEFIPSMNDMNELKEMKENKRKDNNIAAHVLTANATASNTEDSLGEKDEVVKELSDVTTNNNTNTRTDDSSSHVEDDILLLHNDNFTPPEEVTTSTIPKSNEDDKQKNNTKKEKLKKEKKTKLSKKDNKKESRTSASVSTNVSSPNSQANGSIASLQHQQHGHNSKDDVSFKSSTEVFAASCQAKPKTINAFNWIRKLMSVVLSYISVITVMFRYVVDIWSTYQQSINFSRMFSSSVNLFESIIGIVLNYIAYFGLQIGSYCLDIHRYGFRVILLHRYIGFCFAFLYAFPFLVQYVIPWAPPWAPVCLWYAFLVQLFCTQGPTAMVATFRVILPLIFLVEGVSHHSFLLDLNGAELLLISFILASLRSGSICNPIFFLSLAAQCVSAVFLGSEILVQWCQLALALYSLYAMVICTDEYKFIGEDDTSGLLSHHSISDFHQPAPSGTSIQKTKRLDRRLLANAKSRKGR